MKRMIALKHESNPLGYPVKVLHLEDSDADHLLVKRALAGSHLATSITRAHDRASLIESLRDQEFDIVLMDYRLPGFTALDAWAELSKLSATPPCVIVSGAIGEAAAVAAIQSGITDYLHKDNLKELTRVVLRALKLHQSEKERQQVAAALQESERRISELARHLQTSLEQERASISREIHDEIGGSLAALRLDIAWIQRHTQGPQVLERTAAMQEMVSQALTSTQRIMQNTRPAILDQGLAASVQWLTEAHSKRVGLPVTLNCNMDNESTLNAAARLTAYRIVQESLTNISKYAPDAEVRVELSDEGAVLTVEVTDNGAGFEMDRLEKTAGFGLKGLSERAKNIGGWLDVSSAPGRGTSITLTAPLGGNEINNPASQNS
jgi:two-component system sensor histidine kinase UhpB